MRMDNLLQNDKEVTIDVLRVIMRLCRFLANLVFYVDTPKIPNDSVNPLLKFKHFLKFSHCFGDSSCISMHDTHQQTWSSICYKDLGLLAAFCLQCLSSYSSMKNKHNIPQQKR